MISYTPTPRYDYLEEVAATKIGKVLAGTLHTENQKKREHQIINKLRKESRRYV